MLTPEEYRAHDALGLAGLVRKGDVSAPELVDCALREIDRLDPALNAVVLRNDDRARADARAVTGGGVFAGVPFLVKDINVHVAGWPLTHACRFFSGSAPSGHDSALVQNWRRAGLVVIGRTNTPEFATDFACEPALYGPTLNPWEVTRTPGGSSGGAAAAVAAGMVPMAHASDSGGSIRVPAACCGVFGFKPTSGLVASGADIGPLVGGLNCDHVVGWSVRDCAAMLDQTAGQEPGSPLAQQGTHSSFSGTLDHAPAKLRIGMTARSPSVHEPTADMAHALDKAGALLESLGHEIIPFDWPPDSDPLDAAAALWTSEIALAVDLRARSLGRAPRGDELGPLVRFAVAEAQRQNGLEAARLRQRRWDIRRRMAVAMKGLDMLLTPVTAEPPIASGLLGALAEHSIPEWAVRSSAFAPYTEIFNLTGQPAMSVPLFHGSDGLPIGMQLAGRVGEDALLLRLARSLEQALPWSARRPAITG